MLLNGLDCAIEVVSLAGTVGVLAHLRAIRVHIILYKNQVRKQMCGYRRFSIKADLIKFEFKFLLTR